MKSCEIIVNFDAENFRVIESKLNLSEYLIITDDLVILNKGKELGYNIEILSTFFGFFTIEDDSINNKTVERLEFLENNLINNELERKSLVRGLRYSNLVNLNNLERIKIILEHYENVVFLFHNFAFYYQSILDIAKIYEHKCHYGISTILESKIVSVNINERLHRINTMKKRLEVRGKETHDDSFLLRLSKIKIKEEKIKVGFFLINNDTDFYLKPIYPIIKKLNDKQINLISYTFDERTSAQMDEKGFKVTTLTNYFLEATFPYSINISDQLKYIFKEQEKRLSSFATSYYLKNLSKFKICQSLVGKIKNRSKNSKKIVKIIIFPIAILDLLGQQLKKRYILTKWSALRYYVRNLEKYDIIRKIITNPNVKSKLINDLNEYDLFELQSYSVPSIEILKVLKFVNDAKNVESDDIIIKSYLKYFNDNYIVNLLTKLLIVHATIKHILNKKQFQSLMIAADSSPFNNIVCNIANHNNIPTFSIPQVFIKFPKIAIKLPNASKILVSGKRVKDEFIKFGMNENKITVTGNPRYDYIKNEIKEIMSEYKDSKLIIIAMSRWHEKDPQWMSEIIKFCAKNSLEILIKIHPMYKFSSNKIFSEKMIKQIKHNCTNYKYTISYDTDLTKILPTSSILITEYSIVAVEAAFNKIPVIIVNFFRNKDNEYSAGYKNEGIAINVENTAELFSAIKRILNDEQTKNALIDSISKFNFNFNYLHDGNAAERICEILLEDKSDKIQIEN